MVALPARPRRRPLAVALVWSGVEALILMGGAGADQGPEAKFKCVFSVFGLLSFCLEGLLAPALLCRPSWPCQTPVSCRAGPGSLCFLPLVVRLKSRVCCLAQAS